MVKTSISLRMEGDLYKKILEICRQRNITFTDCVHELLKDGLTKKSAEIETVEGEGDKMSINLEDIVKKLNETLGEQVNQAVIAGLTKYDELKRSQAQEIQQLTALQELQRKSDGLEQTIAEIRSRQEALQKQTEELAAKSFPPDICEKVPELCKLTPELQELVKRTKEAPSHRTAEDFLKCPTCGPAFKEEVKKTLEEWCKTDPEICKKITEIVKTHPETFTELEVKRKGFL